MPGKPDSFMFAHTIAKPIRQCGVPQIVKSQVQSDRSLPLKLLEFAMKVIDYLEPCIRNRPFIQPDTQPPRTC